MPLANILGNALGGGSGSALVPSNTVPPEITGDPYVGETLTTTTGTWTGNPVFTYQWRRNGINISGETANTYIITDNDLTSTLSVLVTATNAAGSSTQVSNSIVVSLVFDDIAANLYLYDNNTLGMLSVDNDTDSTISKIAKQLYTYNNFK